MAEDRAALGREGGRQKAEAAWGRKEKQATAQPLSCCHIMCYMTADTSCAPTKCVSAQVPSS